jgi:hypothetical protein
MTAAGSRPATMRARLASSATLPASRSGRLALAALVLVLAAGAAVRIAFMAAWRPAFMGYPDAGTYIGNARENLFGDPFHPATYSYFLRVLHDLAPNLSVTIAAQHALAVASALLLYLAVRRAGAPAWAALVPAAVVSLNGTSMFVEHSTLSETLFVLVQSAAIYAAIRAAGPGHLAWMAAAAALLAVATTVRITGLTLIPVLVLWLALFGPGAWRRRLAHAAVAAVAAAVVLGTYVAVQHRYLAVNYPGSEYVGLTRAGQWNLYGAVAPFADCSQFEPPAGTEPLCDPRPEAERPNTEQYIFDPAVSPAVQAFGTPFAATEESHEKVAAFARAVILAQPLDYLASIGDGMVRYVAPEYGAEFGNGPSYEFFVRTELWNGQRLEEARQRSLPYYGTDSFGYVGNDRLLQRLFAYERATRVQGPLFVLLAVLALIGPFVAQRGRTRAVAVLLSALALVSLVVPVATHFFDARTSIPAFGPLAAAAALGGWAVWQRVAARRGRPAGA